MARPNQFLLFPDPRFSADKILSVTSQDGRFIGTWTPESTNTGDMQPYAEGDPSSDTAIEARILQAGDLYNGTWGWMESGGSSIYGQTDFRFQHHLCDPFADDAARGDGAEVAYSRKYRRLLFFRQDGATASAAVAIRYIDAADMGTMEALAFASTEFDPTADGSGRYFGGNSDYGGIVVLDMQDGTMRMFLPFLTGTGIDMWTSADGGLTWALAAADIAQGFDDPYGNWMNLRGDTSGSWIRLVQVAHDGSLLRTLISGDGGATWTQVMAAAGGGVKDNGDTWEAGNRCFDIVSLDDLSGRFMLIANTIFSTEYQYVQVYTASGSDAWQELTDGTFTTGTFLQPTGSNQRITSLVLYRDESRIHAMAFIHNSSTPTGAQAWVARSALTELSTDESAWSDLQGTTDPNQYGTPAARGTRRFRPSNVHACWAGDRAVFMSGMVDNESSGALEEQTSAWQVFGWSRRAFSLQLGAQGIGAEGSAPFEYEWSTDMGSPIGAITSSRFTATTAGSPASNWTADRLRLVSPDGTADSYVFRLNGGASPTHFWGDHAAIMWTLKAEYAHTSAGTRIFARARLLSRSGTGIGALMTVDVGVRYQVTASTGWAVVYDNVANQALATCYGINNSHYFEYRLATQYEGGTAIRAELNYRQIGTATWFASTQVALATTGTYPTQELQWGIGIGGSGAPGSTSYWKDFRVAGVTQLSQIRYTEDATKAGKPLSPKSAYVTQGVSVRWGGGAAFFGDTYSYLNGYRNGLAAVHLPSPRQAWRTTTADTNRGVWDAGDGAVWIHDGIGFFGCRARRAIVEYSSVSDFSTLVAAETVNFAMTQTGASAVTMTTVSGDYAALAGGLASGLEAGAITDHLVMAAAGGTAFVVGKHLTAGGVQALAPMSTSLTGAAFASNTQVSVLAPDVVAVFAARRIARFMRITLDQTLNGPNLSSLHQVGSIVVGTTLPFTVPMNWVYDDREEGNVTLTTGIGGMRWSRKEGPPRRTIEGRVEGDINRTRQAMRQLLRDLAEYGNRTMVLVLDDQQLTFRESVLLVRHDGPTQHENQGWVADSATGRMIPVGDRGVVFSEER